MIAHTPVPGGARRPFSAAVTFGGVVYASGQVGIDRSTGKLAEGLAAQAEQTLRNLQQVLEQAGSGLDRALKCTVFLTPGCDAAVFNQVYERFFPAPAPARSLVFVAGLAAGCLVEVECVAAVGSPSQD